jgi:tetratricopeptide (TPR) repeat protein
LAPDTMRVETSIALAQMLRTEATRDLTTSELVKQSYLKEALDLMRGTNTKSVDAEILLASMLFEANLTSSEAMGICQSIVRTVKPIHKALKEPLAQISSTAKAAETGSPFSGGGGTAAAAAVAVSRSDFFFGLNSLLSSRENQLEAAYALLLKSTYAAGDSATVLTLAQDADTSAVAFSTDALLTVASASVGLGKLSVATSYLKAAIQSIEDGKFSANHQGRVMSLASRAGHMMVRHGYVEEAKELIALTDAIVSVSPNYTTLQLELHAHVLTKSSDAGDVEKAEKILRANARIPSISTLMLNGLESTAKAAAAESEGLTAVGHVVLGTMLKETQSFHEAAWCFRVAMLKSTGVMNQHELADIIFELGSSLLESQKYLEAVNFLLLARSKRPHHAPTHNNLGVAYIRLGRRTEAKRMMKAALRIQDGCLARFNLGVLLQEHTSSHGMAVTQFRAALRMHATETNGAGTEKNHVVDMVDIKARLARVLDAGGDLPEALSVLGEAVQDLELRSSRLQTQILIEQLAGRSAEHEAAMSVWRMCKSVLANVLSQRSSVFSKLGRHRESVDTMLHARAIWAGDPEAPVHLQSLIDLGNAYLHAGNVQAAQTAYEQVVSSDPHHIVGLNNMGVVAHRQKEYAAAETFFRRILVLQPRNKKATEYLKVVKREREEGGKKKRGWTWGQMFALAPAEPVNL